MSGASFQIPTLLTTIAVTGGGMSGALHATRRHMDIIGVFVVATCTGGGGGILRDVLLGNSIPVFFVRDLIAMAMIGALAGYFFARFVEQLGPGIYIVDSLLIGVWVIYGAQAAFANNLSPYTAVFLGLTTAVGGGIIRDVLCREVPTALMPGQFVAMSAFIAAMLYVVIQETWGLAFVAQVVAIFSATGLRVAGARYNWYTPDAVTVSRQVGRLFRRKASVNQ